MSVRFHPHSYDTRTYAVATPVCVAQALHRLVRAARSRLPPQPARPEALG